MIVICIHCAINQNICKNEDEFYNSPVDHDGFSTNDYELYRSCNYCKLLQKPGNYMLLREKIELVVK